ncbi:MAG: single-stranded DNA-binding protein [Crocinitomicaceae bacterium]|nr:single-stranded DNA-binding protein [Crocinitomicaceae bacterium]
MQRSNQTLNGGVGTGVNSIFFDKREMSTNHVNLIGRITSELRYYEHPSGRRVAQFTLSTRESYLDENGGTKVKRHWHRIAAWGRWVKVLEEFGKVNLQVALEGKLITRFYFRDGVKHFISEVEVNDLVIMS